MQIVCSTKPLPENPRRKTKGAPQPQAEKRPGFLRAMPKRCRAVGRSLAPSESRPRSPPPPGPAQAPAYTNRCTTTSKSHHTR